MEVRSMEDLPTDNGADDESGQQEFNAGNQQDDCITKDHQPHG